MAARSSVGRQLQIKIEELAESADLLDIMREVLREDDFLYCPHCKQNLDDSEEYGQFSELRQALQYGGNNLDEVEQAFTVLTFEQQNALAQGVRKRAPKAF